MLLQEWFSKFISFDTNVSRFVRSITRQSVDNYYSGGQSTVEDRKNYITCDQIAAAVAIDERVAARITEVTCCGVDRSGHMTRGQVVIDWKSKPTTDNDKSRCILRLVTAIDKDLYERMLLESVSTK